MADEISVSAILVETEDGSYRTHCPDLGITAAGKNADEAIRNLKDEIARFVREKGPRNIRLNAVKCVKIRIPV